MPGTEANKRSIVAGSNPPNPSSSGLRDAITAMGDAIRKLKGKYSGAKLLDALDAHDKKTTDELDAEIKKRRLGLSLPLTKQELELTDLCIGMHINIAEVYASTLPAQDKNKLSEKKKDQLTRAVCGAIHHYKHALMYAYGSYRAEPGGVWKEIHDICERSRHFNHESVHTTDGKLANDSDIVRSYKHALLLGLSNPYQLPFRGVYEIDAALFRWIDKARLSDVPQKQSNHCRFVVDTALDRPGVPLLSQRGVDNSEGTWVLDTTKLAVALKGELKELRRKVEKTNTKLDLTNNFTMLEIYRSLVSRWGTHRLRAAERKRLSTFCDLAIGMSAINHALSGGQKSFEIYDEPTRFQGESALSESWQIADISKTGFRLKLMKPDRSQISVNELIAVRPVDLTMGWLTGLVRWARRGEEGSLEIGARTISADSQPVAVSTNTLSRQANRAYTPGLFLHQRDAEPMIITPTGCLGANSTFAVLFENDEQTFAVSRVIMSTPVFDWVEVHSDTRDLTYLHRMQLPH